MSNDNPWEVSDASVFLKYCCPECDYQCSQLDSFGIHATKNHDLSSILFEETKDIDSKLVKEEPLCDLNENSKVKEGDFDDFIENDDYVDDPDFDEDKPIKLPKKRKKSSESDQIIQTRTKLSQYQKSKLVTPDVNPKENGWWMCSSCPKQTMFLFFFELVTHWTEFHENAASFVRFGAATAKEIIERDVILASNGWKCYLCSEETKFEHKFQLVSHWHEKHSQAKHTYEMCQWCMEVFDCPTNSMKHHSEVHPDLPRWQYQCPSCVKPMTDLQLLVIHCEKRHQETLVYPIRCNTCDRPFIFQEALLHHQKTEHGQEIDTLHCDLCAQDFFAKAPKLIHDKLHGIESNETLYPCKHCSHASFSIPDIVEHYKENHELQELPYYQCESCDFVSEKLSSAQKHAKSVHEDENYRPLKCRHCDFTCAGPMVQFRRHLEVHSTDRSLTCDICQKVLTTRNSLRRHKQCYHEDLTCVCDICGHTTKHPEWLKRHMKTKHGGKESKVKCPHCDYHARDKNSLEVHIDRKHQDIAGELSHFCPQCGRGFIHQYSLTNHLYYHKTGHEHTAQARPGPKGEDITITCKFCGKQCKQSIISRHIRMAHPKECFEEKALNTPGLKCSICDERYLQKSGVKVHEYKVHGIPHFKNFCKNCKIPHNNNDHKCYKRQDHPCNYCGKVYLSSYRLKFHIKGVHKNEKTHFCKPCGKYFADEALLKHHTYQSHSKVTCPHCKKLILNQHHLKRHLALEHDVKDGAYFCEICPKTVFFSEFHFNKHMVGKHGSENSIGQSYHTE